MIPMKGLNIMKEKRNVHLKVQELCDCYATNDPLKEMSVVKDDADQEETAGKQIDQPGPPFAEIEPVNAENAEKGEQDPGDVVIYRAGDITDIRRAIERGDQEEIDQPADKEKTECEEVDGTAHRTAEVEAMGAQETEDPEKVADSLAVGVHEKSFQSETGGLISSMPCDSIRHGT